MKQFLSGCDKTIFLISVITILVLLLVGVLFPQTFAALWDGLNNTICANFGWFYLLLVFLFFFYFLYLAASKYGKLRLGAADEQPEYSNFAWIAMLFSAGVGIGFVYWGVAEPLTHFMAPPYWAEPQTETALQLALSLCTTHWGVMGWVPYTIAGLPIAIAAYCFHKPLSFSSALYGLLGDKISGPWGKLADALSVIATIAGISTTLGFAVLSLCFAAQHFFGIPNTLLLNLVVTLLMACFFIGSSYLGIKKGMRRVSQFSIVMALAVMIFLLLFGPTRFILNSVITSLGYYLNNFFYTHTWTDPIYQSGWLNYWTVFYVGWYLAWAPFVGGFIARISRGRTLREFLWGVIFVPIVLTFIWFSVMGSSSIYTQLQTADLYAAVAADASSATYALLSYFPFSGLMSGVVMLTMLAFAVTSIDASSLFCSTVISGGKEPARRIKVFCGLLIAATAFFLLSSGGLTALQTMSIVGAFPFALIAVLLFFSTQRMVRQAFAASNTPAAAPTEQQKWAG